MVNEKFIEIRELRQPTELTLKQTRRELGTSRRIEKKERKGRKVLQIVRRKRSLSGRIGSTLETGFETGRKGITRTLQEGDRPRTGISKVKRLTRGGGIRTGRRGRPKGTVKFTDPRTGSPIGVFEHRKILAQQRRLEIIRARGEAAVTPRQQQVLREIERRDRIRQVSKERRVIPGTSGDIGIDSITREINSAANIFN